MYSTGRLPSYSKSSLSLFLSVFVSVYTIILAIYFSSQFLSLISTTFPLLFFSLLFSFSSYFWFSSFSKFFPRERARRSMVFLNFWKSDFLLFLFSLRLVTSFLFLFLSSYTFPALVSCSPMYIFYFILLFITGTKES